MRKKTNITLGKQEKTKNKEKLKYDKKLMKKVYKNDIFFEEKVL